MIERGADRYGVELRRGVKAVRLVGVGRDRLTREERRGLVQMRIVGLAEALAGSSVVLSPLVHRADATRDEELADVGLERREGVGEVAGDERTMRLDREPLRRDAAVMRE